MNVSQSIAPEQSISMKESPVKSALTWKVLFLLGLTILVYFDVMSRLIHQWSNDPNFSHGFIVPLFSIFVVWTQRKELAALPVKPSSAGLALIILSLVMVIVGSLGAELFVARVSLVLLLAGMVIFLLGWQHFRAILFPWLFLFFMVPIPAIIFAQLTLPLQTLAAQLATAALQTVGIPVLREGNVIALPAMPLEVAEACSGIRSLLSLGTLAIIYGYFLEEKLLPRVLIALASIPIAVMANGFRIFGTGVLVQYWDADKALGFFHEFSGWLVFVVSMFLLFLIHRSFTILSRIYSKRTAN
jgi:exosortase